MKDIPQRWTQSGPSSQESGFHIFNKAVFPFRCAPVCVAEYALISLNIFKYP